MKNQVTVVLSMPWVMDMKQEDYKQLYDQLFSIAHDDTCIGHTEANYLISGMTAKHKTYSYETSASDVDFAAYADLSRYVPDKKLKIQVGKIGPHVQTGQRDDERYYNVVLIDFDDGQMTQQIVGHMDGTEGALIQDYKTLTGQQMRSKLSALKSVAVSEAKSHVRQAPVLNPELVSSHSEETADFAL